MNKSDFSQQTPGKVVRTLKGYFAFLPAPLPPAVAWSNRLLSALSKADRSLARLAALGTVDIPFLIQGDHPALQIDILSAQIDSFANAQPAGPHQRE